MLIKAVGKNIRKVLKTNITNHQFSSLHIQISKFCANSAKICKSQDGETVTFRNSVPCGSQSLGDNGRYHQVTLKVAPVGDPRNSLDITLAPN